MTWKVFHRPRPMVKVDMPDGKAVDVRALEWNPEDGGQVTLPMPYGAVTIFSLRSGRVAKKEYGTSPARPCIRPESLVALREHIASRLGKNFACEPAPLRSSHVLVTADDHLGALVVSGGDKIVHLLTTAGRPATEGAAALEEMFAWAEHQARVSATMKMHARSAGKKSASKRKTVRTHRRGRDD